MILYFSGTGNSRRVAEFLGRLLGERVLPIMELINEGTKTLQLQEKESLGFVFPGAVEIQWGFIFQNP